MSAEGTGGRVVVVGGGIAGLAAAFRLREEMHAAGLNGELVVYEQAEVCGGATRTERLDGFCLDRGPNGWLANEPLTTRLIGELGLSGERVRSDDAARHRFIYTRGRLHRLPDSPGKFLASGLLGPWEKLRVLAEVLISRRRDDADESIYDFGRRRLGKGFAETMLDPMVSGIFAGNVRELSLPATFPKMRSMELEHGGLFKALLAKKRAAGWHGSAQGEPSASPLADPCSKGGREARSSETVGGVARPSAVPACRDEAGPCNRTDGGPAGPAGILTTLRGGVGRLTDQLAEELAPHLRMNRPVTTLTRNGADFVLWFDGAQEHFDAVVLAVPAHAAAGIVRDFAPAAAAALDGISFAHTVVVCHVYDAERLPVRLNGFGHLIPRRDGLRALGCLWTSCIFPEQAPPGKLLLRTILGGAHDPAVLDVPDDELLATVVDNTTATLGIRVAPSRSWVFRHPRGIAQYTLGHRERLAVLDQLCTEVPGLAFVGASYRGVSLNRCVRDAYTVAPTVLRRFGLSVPVILEGCDRPPE